jgi:hypothetical protein
MRRLMIKLVAIETMLVGWLSYWIFLIYANNPAVSAGLGDQLSRFPQLSFTTVDLAVLVIIAAFAIGLAFKFHRGLRPGIRLERALQMLENLMKRNLVLEAQVAELRVEKVEKTPPKALPASANIPVPGLRGPGFASMSPPVGSEPRQGSWEKAFRTPLEAGPPPTKVAGSGLSEAPFERETGIPPPRIEETPPIVGPTKPILVPERPSTPLVIETNDKSSDRPTMPPPLSATSSAGWEDSPKYVGESLGILTPSSPNKGTRSSDMTGLKQPYIPVPAPRMPPPSVIVGPMNQKPSSPTRQTPKPIVRPTFSLKGPSKEPATSSIELKPPSPPIIIDKTVPQMDLKPPEPTKLTITTSEEETREKASDKTASAPKKRVPDEEA